jgi:hypothetical protein
MRIKRSTTLNVSAEQAWAEVCTTQLLHYVAAPLLTFKAIDPPDLPNKWQERRYLVKLRLFGLLPIGTQWIVITCDNFKSTFGTGRYHLRDDGTGTLAKRWDHRIFIEALTGTRCRYTDIVDIEAGVLTPMIWILAQMFYWHRQRRWHQLTASGFNYKSMTST